MDDSTEILVDGVKTTWRAMLDQHLGIDKDMRRDIEWDLAGNGFYEPDYLHAGCVSFYQITLPPRRA